MAAAKIVKRTAEYTVVQKRSGRHGVRGADGNWINGDDKTKILVEEGLVEVKLPEPEPESEAEAEADADEAEASDAEGDAES